MIVETLQWLQGTALAVSISERWFPFVESVHVITMAMVAGTIFIVDTRLMGLTSRSLAFTYLSQRLLPWTWWAFGCSVLTGTLLFIANATGYYDNAPFRWKMLLMLLAGVNMLYFQLVTFRGVATWDSGNPPLPARTAGISSILLWSGVIGLGRWIGFTT
ncbi:MAG TPA: DUF6644 family protein [Steroidobacteraceae bacterium]|nr:DUF6644 family protein [Steroidobacteraceae bacterium]